MEMKPICKYGINCKKGANCDFRHSKVQLKKFKKFTKTCIYGTNCKHLKQKMCTFYHPPSHFNFDLRSNIKKKKKNSNAGKIVKKDQEIEHMRQFLTDKVIENAKQEAANKLAQEELEALREKNRIMTEALEKVESKISRLESLRKK